jgi:predicted methyltransferase
MRLSLFLALAFALATPASAADPELKMAVADAQRSPAFRDRDLYRHPFDELEFFGIRPDAAVVEIWPATGYWTEILAPYLHDHGQYTVAGLPADTGKEDIDKARTKLQAKLSGDPGRYGRVTVTQFGHDHYEIAPPGSADFVLTFSNLHNWMSAGYADAAMAAFFAALKPGGVLGIEDHRGRDTLPQDPKAANGYVRQDYAIELAKRAGFAFEGASEINANPKDTKDWPEGVWTLPPTLRLGDQDRAKYEAIGEADNFVLKFRKPAL